MRFAHPVAHAASARPAPHIPALPATCPSPAGPPGFFPPDFFPSGFFQNPLFFGTHLGTAGTLGAGAAGDSGAQKGCCAAVQGGSWAGMHGLLGWAAHLSMVHPPACSGLPLVLLANHRPCCCCPGTLAAGVHIDVNSLFSNIGGLGATAGGAKGEFDSPRRGELGTNKGCAPLGFALQPSV